MTAATTLTIPTRRSAESARVRKTAAYENWRPPVVGVALLVRVGADQLLVVEHAGLLLPVGVVQDGQTPESAAQEVLRLEPFGIPILRRVAVDQIQMRRRKVITHIVASRPLSLADAASLTYRDPRALIRTIPTADVVGHLPECAHGRTLAALGALEHGELAHLEAGVVQRTEPAGTADPSSPRGR